MTFDPTLLTPAELALDATGLLELRRTEVAAALKILDRYRLRRRLPRRARADVTRLQDRADTITSLLLELERESHRARTEAAAISPKWERMRPAATVLRGMVHGDPANVARADAVQANVTEILDDMGVNVREPNALYAVLCGANLMTELAANGARKGTVDPNVALAVGRIGQTLTGSLLDYLPPEAR